MGDQLNTRLHLSVAGVVIAGSGIATQIMKHTLMEFKRATEDFAYLNSDATAAFPGKVEKYSLSCEGHQDFDGALADAVLEPPFRLKTKVAVILRYNEAAIGTINPERTWNAYVIEYTPGTGEEGDKPLGFKFTLENADNALPAVATS